MKWNKNATTAAALLLVLNTVIGSPAAIAADGTSATDLPAAPEWGYFVDTYKNNISANSTVAANPAIGVLSQFLKLWTPGSSWDNGTKLNNSVLDSNIQQVIDMAARRTAAEADAAYFDDRRKQSYSVIEGLGSLTDIYRTKAGATTTITEIPGDATTKKYDDGGTDYGDPNSELGKVVTLVKTLRGNYSSTNPAKNYYSYMRPFRWANDTSIIVPALVPAISTTPATDGGFPSGHTNASYLSAIAMAYAVPERFQELLTRASELGNNRIVAGMHSPLDVMGGRVMATALSAAILSDPDNAAIKQAAYEEAHTKLLTQTGTSEDRFSDYEKNKEQYMQRLVYGFTTIGSTSEPMIVPKEAEVLLETRLPYLDADQRRQVLATTGLSSGYPVLDDPEGWGRLNLFAAADGFGAFDKDVTVTMDADKGGFHALDSWRNNISGAGSLTKAGSGTLKLTGSNTYSGGTRINGGKIEGDSATAFGSGNVEVSGGTLAEQVSGKITIGGNYAQAEQGTLELNIGSQNDLLEVKGSFTASGKLRLQFEDGYDPGSRVLTLITHGDGQRSGQFTSVETSGLPSKYKVSISYLSDRIQLSVEEGPTNPSAPAGETSAPSNPDKRILTLTAAADASGIAAVQLQGALLNELLEKAGSLSGNMNLQIKADEHAKSIKLSIPTSAIGKLSESAVQNLLITTPLGSIQLNKAVLNTLKNASGDQIQVEITSVGTASFQSDTKELIGTRPVIDFKIQSGAANLTSFGGGSIEIRIPYQPKQEEDNQALLISYIDSEGKPHFLPNSGYREQDGQVVVTTDHLSNYAVSYNKRSFSDTGTHWASGNITYLAARGIVSGSGNNRFLPDENITRAEFVKMLAGLVDADVSGYTSNAFTDVKGNSWYMPYVAWAADKQIVQGNSNNQFLPNSRISREEICVMLSRFAGFAGYTLPTNTGASGFADGQLISAWAKDAVNTLSQAGIISGKGNQQFDPQGKATRAEGAKILALLLQLK